MPDKFSATSTRPAPGLGESTEEILAEIGETTRAPAPASEKPEDSQVTPDDDPRPALNRALNGGFS